MMKSVREACVPRDEVLKGDLQDALFAADFGHVVAGTAPDVYKDPKTFFQNTYPATALKKVVKTIFQRLADPNEAGAAVRLSTGFGGGKTHTLIALWHLARGIADPTLGTELLPAAGRPKEVAAVGMDAREYGKTVCGSHGDLQTHSLWGEMAYQLGGEPGYRRIAEQGLDTPQNVPNAATVRDMLPDRPLLILLDELVIYLSVLNEQEQKAALSFVNTLISEVSARRQAVIVITDPAGQPVYQKEAAAIADATRLTEADKNLNDVLGRKMSNFDPIGDETPGVITRRLFEHISQEAAQQASAEYYQAYQRIHAEHPDAVPPETTTLEYAQQIERCYPFHPRLLDTAQNRLGALQDFNKSRGTLRLFARILRDVWESDQAPYLITAGDLNWASERIQADLLERLNRDNFKAAINADVIYHAGQLDAHSDTDIHRRVASALLLESIPMSGTGMDKRDIGLAVLRLTDVGHEPGEAIDRLMSVCWHTYKDETGVRFLFRYEPNANKIIEERADGVPYEDARQGVLALAQNYFKGNVFSLIAYPSSPKSVPDSAELKLILSDNEALAQRVCNWQDDSNPEARFPRRFRNAIFGIAPTPSMLEDAIQAFRRARAAEQILQEEQDKRRGKRSAPSPLEEEVEQLLPTLRRRSRLLTCWAFNRVVFQGRKPATLPEKYLVPADSALIDVNGQARLKQFLDDNRYIYQSLDVLDIDLLLRQIVPGATPSLEHPGAFSASAVHERALEHSGLRLMLDAKPVREAILKAVAAGRLVVRLSNGDAYDSLGCVTGPPGMRTREEAHKLTTLHLNRDVLLALPDAPCVSDWLKVDEPPPAEYETLSLYEAAAQKGVPESVVREAIDLGRLDSKVEDGSIVVVKNPQFDVWQPSDGRRRPVVADSWDKAIQYAARRPLTSLTLRTTDQNAADRLIAVAQPFGADALWLTILATGKLTDGGEINFAVNEARHNNQLKPIELARKMLRAVQPSSASFSAELKLELPGRGLPDSGPRFEQAQAKAGPNVQLTAEFGPEEAANG